jgi:hypothetical protein
VWVGRRRLRWLENAVSAARADQAELQRRLALFEKIAEAAGATLGDPTSAAPAPTAPVPPSLLAAARDPRQEGAAVRLAVDGRDVIAVVGGEGSEGSDPIEWWAAIRHLMLGPCL